MHAVLTNQIADIFHFNDNLSYPIHILANNYFSSFVWHIRKVRPETWDSCWDPRPEYWDPS